MDLFETQCIYTKLFEKGRLRARYWCKYGNCKVTIFWRVRNMYVTIIIIIIIIGSQSYCNTSCLQSALSRFSQLYGRDFPKSWPLICPLMKYGAVVTLACRADRLDASWNSVPTRFQS